ncbi:MAG: 6-carboxytetrahydropterin synthase QueD [Phycisphaeraceae bacterium]|nr:6-carboxytetrahydropterin synthase QueD [Phycisphaeraceae bacterium]MCW5754309.1 6-carboxytetrahydropterin synthase QueD [Phycisphaeraceae bacterium]
MEIFKEFTFEAAHQLPWLPQGHKCRNMHGHSYHVRLTLRGRIDPETGWVRDFAEIKQAFQPLLRQLDHAVLNDVPGLEKPTTENIARWIWQRLRPSLPQLVQIDIRETATSGCVYRGEDEA